jgi:hypothetical protein
MSASLKMLLTVARRLGSLASEAAFVGGAVLELLATESGAPAPRPTDDVDIVVELASPGEYARLVERLRGLGFREDQSEGAPLCRWLVEGIAVDVMPTDASVLGFTNRWYAGALAHAERREVQPGLVILLVTPAFFLGTKLEAFSGRGNGDHAASHDIEDFIAVVDGRADIVEQVAAAPGDLRTYLADSAGRLLGNRAFIDAVPGHLPPDLAAQARLPIVFQRLGRIAGR